MTDHRDPAHVRLTELFGAWRAEIDEVPLPSLVDPEYAVDVVIEAKKKGGRVHPPPDGACTRPPGNARDEAV
ncbi:hypothetical protein H4696_007603 [Amycolatopsis lexingtonensis]|uniref:Uncharacterized protein n=1 Tax=Amycolatopsis lexingtonensis TaxID=218822 RepID=A0ABR9IBE8_9PSEU|nr:hypothetical protein [Amycolatopsis lexingtonensis]MBE1500503.1 hypothetical protein [Amycolatopsis lexingtonensis]